MFNFYSRFFAGTESMKRRLRLRKMGYIRDQQGIINRYLREKENWEFHLQKTREFILQSAGNKDKNMAVVLGSGWLLDIPLDELARDFNNVVLYDILHPSQIKKRIEKYPNVKCKKADLTGGLTDSLYEIVNDKNRDRLLVESFSGYSFDFPGRPDFVISCNILSQMGSLLIDFLKKKKIFTEKELNRLEQIIQLNHLEMLPEGKSCLITDYEEELYTAEDEFAGTKPLLKVKLPMDEADKYWQWKFDTQMRYREKFMTYLNMTGKEI